MEKKTSIRGKMMKIFAVLIVINGVQSSFEFIFKRCRLSDNQ